jgi:hypothetical protein
MGGNDEEREEEEKLEPMDRTGHLFLHPEKEVAVRE